MLRISFRVEVDEDGVRTGEALASLLVAEPPGDAVPSFESLPFLEDFVESLLRLSYTGGRTDEHLS